MSGMNTIFFDISDFVYLQITPSTSNRLARGLQSEPFGSPISFIILKYGLSSYLDIASLTPSHGLSNP